MLSRNKCFDIFQKTRVNDFLMFTEKPIKKMVRYKVKRRMLEEL